MKSFSNFFGFVVFATFLDCASANAQYASPTQTSRRAVSPQKQSKSAPFRLVSAERDRLYRLCLPKVRDPDVQAMLEDPTLIFYTEREIPRAHQDWSSGLPGVHSPSYNISANGSEAFGNGNLEFPWGKPAGTHRTTNVQTFRFIRLPKDRKGRTLPIVWYRPYFADNGASGYAWLFPKGTVVGEVLMMRGPDGRDYTFELRLRIREYGEWAVDIFRPFPRAQDLAKRIKELRPDWRKRSHLIHQVSYLEGKQAMTQHVLADYHPSSGPVFHQAMGVDVLPALNDNRLVAELLTTTTFKSALGETWREDRYGRRACAPTTNAAFHIMPRSYDGGFIEVDRKSCMRCHETVGQHVSRFDFSRDWYGRIRGSDGIFSFHPFSLDSISYNGMGNGARMRGDMIAGGILAQYDPSRHPGNIYQRLRTDLTKQYGY